MTFLSKEEILKYFGELSDDYKLLFRFDHLSVYLPEPEYLLAMKSISMRIGVESADVDDVKYLIDFLKLEKIDDVFDIIKKYYPHNQIPQKTYYAIEEILQKILNNKNDG